MLVGMAMETVHSLPPVGLNLAEGFQVSNWSFSPRVSSLRFYKTLVQLALLMKGTMGEQSSIYRHNISNGGVKTIKKAPIEALVAYL